MSEQSSARNSLLRVVLLGFCLTGASVLIGCSQGSPEVAPPQAPVVPVSQPVQQQVTDYVDFTGRTDAINSVSIVPRVTGYLFKMPFKEGALVKKDKLLFEIDPRPYKATYDLNKALVAQNAASLKLAQQNNARAEILIAAKPPGIEQAEVDQTRSQLAQAVATLNQAKANLETARLNLSFCSITSPIDGRVGRYFHTVGNLVNQDQTLLTTVVSQDPMYAYFDMDEPTLLQIRKAIGEGRIKVSQKETFRVYMGLQGEEGHPHLGHVSFVNNQVNPATGSISVRGTFPNRLLQDGIYLLSPGMFVRIHLPIGQPHSALLIIDRAIASDQGLKYVYVIDSQNKAQYRRVTTGPLQPNGLRVITKGLEQGEWVAVGTLQQIRPHMQVQTEKIAMPTLGSPKNDKVTR